MDDERAKAGWRAWSKLILASAMTGILGVLVGGLGGTVLGLIARVVFWNPAMAEFLVPPPDITSYSVVGMVVGGAIGAVIACARMVWLLRGSLANRPGLDRALCAAPCPP